MTVGREKRNKVAMKLFLLAKIEEENLLFISLLKFNIVYVLKVFASILCILHDDGKLRQYFAFGLCCYNIYTTDQNKWKCKTIWKKVQCFCADFLLKKFLKYIVEKEDERMCKVKYICKYTLSCFIFRGIVCMNHKIPYEIFQSVLFFRIFLW